MLRVPKRQGSCQEPGDSPTDAERFPGATAPGDAGQLRALLRAGPARRSQPLPSLTDMLDGPSGRPGHPGGPLPRWPISPAPLHSSAPGRSSGAAAAAASLGAPEAAKQAGLVGYQAERPQVRPRGCLWEATPLERGSVSAEEERGLPLLLTALSLSPVGTAGRNPLPVPPTALSLPPLCPSCQWGPPGRNPSSWCH